MTRGFDARREFAAEMHRRYLSDAMAAYWGVDGDAITAIHGDSDGALSADKTGGIDAIVQTTGSAPVFVAQRVRTLRRYSGTVYPPDFSLRVQTATGDDSEFVRLLNAYRTGRDLPSCYLFGIAAADSREDAKQRGLSALFWFDTAAMFEAIDTGQLKADEHTSDTGEITRYFGVDDLREAGCIVAETRGLPLKSATDDDQRLRDAFPRVTPRVQTVRSRLQDYGETT